MLRVYMRSSIMRRTQVLLKDDQIARLDAAAGRRQRSRSEIVGELIDRHLREIQPVVDWKANLLSAAGMWKDRPEVEQEIMEARRSMDRDVFADRE
jgi:metal-responsive CopG/Arc/MetJ family transcriptional regulator